MMTCYGWTRQLKDQTVVYDDQERQKNVSWQVIVTGLFNEGKHFLWCWALICRIHLVYSVFPFFRSKGGLLADISTMKRWVKQEQPSILHLKFNHFWFSKRCIRLLVCLLAWNTEIKMGSGWGWGIGWYLPSISSLFKSLQQLGLD